MSDARQAPAGDFDYEAHGAGYTGRRQPDPRIAALVTTAAPADPRRLTRRTFQLAGLTLPGAGEAAALAAYGEIDPAALEKACRQLLDAGVREWVILHFPEGAAAMGRDGELHTVSSVALPPAGRSASVQTTGVPEQLVAPSDDW